jgi:hypothetical protein
MPVQFAIYDSPGGLMLADFSHRITGAKFSCGEHGWQAANGTILANLVDILRYYVSFGTPHVEINNNGINLFSGRLEDPAMIIDEDNGDSLRIGALGYWHATSDVLYTAFWSTTETGGWTPVQVTDLTLRNPKMYEMSTDDQELLIGLKKNATYRSTNDIGSYTFVIPDKSSRTIVGISFDVEIALPANWNFEVRTLNDDFSGAVSQKIIVGVGGTIRRSLLLTFTGQARLEIAVYNSTGANLTFAAENSTNYAHLTNIRIVTSTTNEINTTFTAARAAGSAVTATVGTTANMHVGQLLSVSNVAGTVDERVTILSIVNATQFTANFANAYAINDHVQAFVIHADEIVNDIISTITAVNPNQMSALTNLISAHDIDLTDESYEDEVCTDVLVYLANIGDTSGELWEVGVYDDRQLYFRPKGSAATTWYVDSFDLEIEQSEERLANSVYASYKGPNNRRLRTTTTTDQDSINRYQITRQASDDVNTTSGWAAQIARDTILAQQASPIPRARVRYQRMYNAAGEQWPVYYTRTGDIVVIRNLPGTYDEQVDRLRSFFIVGYDYDLDTNTISVDPESTLAGVNSILIHNQQRNDAARIKQPNRRIIWR